MNKERMRLMFGEEPDMEKPDMEKSDSETFYIPPQIAPEVKKLFNGDNKILPHCKYEEEA